MAKLRHLALHSENPEAAAEFYKRAFGMREIGRKTDSPLASLNIYLTDGTIHLAILKYRTAELARVYGGSEAYGISHFGFWVEDVEQTRERLREAGSEYVDRRAADQNVLFEEKWKGPDGVVFDITDKGWTGAKPPSAD
jgi:methylmalonyl-CoA/ethylmalonyl-CoA epimerase